MYPDRYKPNYSSSSQLPKPPPRRRSRPSASNPLGPATRRRSAHRSRKPYRNGNKKLKTQHGSEGLSVDTRRPGNTSASLASSSQPKTVDRVAPTNLANPGDKALNKTCLPRDYGAVISALHRGFGPVPKSSGGVSGKRMVQVGRKALFRIPADNQALIAQMDEYRKAGGEVLMATCYKYLDENEL